MALHREPYKGVYANMEFPPYKFQEFPKAVRLVQGGEIVERIAQNQSEELALRATSDLAPKDPIVEERDGAIAQLVRVQDEKREAEDRALALEATLSHMKKQLDSLIAAQAAGFGAVVAAPTAPPIGPGVPVEGEPGVVTTTKLALGVKK